MLYSCSIDCVNDFEFIGKGSIIGTQIYSDNSVNLSSTDKIITYNSEFRGKNITLNGVMSLLDSEFIANDQINVEADGIELCSNLYASTISFLNSDSFLICSYDTFARNTNTTNIISNDSLIHTNITGDSVRDLQIVSNTLYSRGIIKNIHTLYTS